MRFLSLLIFSQLFVITNAQTSGLPLPREANRDLIIESMPGAGDNPVPERLSDLPALLAAGQGEGHTVPGVIPYQPVAELWSDNAAKSRYLALPGLAQITIGEDGDWEFPDGTVTIKNFLMPLDERAPEDSLQLLETRIFVRLNGQWRGYSYEWNEQETDAVLLDGRKTRDLMITRADGSQLDYAWTYPSRTDCFRCHTEAANVTLGISTEQLNSDFAYPWGGAPANQLRSMDYASIFTDPLGDPAELPALADYHDSSLSLETRAKAYMAANCAMCHQPGGGTPTQQDLRWELTLEEMNIVDVHPERWDYSLPEPRIVAPGNPDSSVLLLRMRDTNPFHRMPPLGVAREDEAGTALIESWIESLGANEFSGWLIQ